MGAESPVYLSKIVLDGKVDANKHFALKPMSNALKGVRAVLKGECDATLLDDETLSAAAKMEGGAELKRAFTSPKLPATPLSIVAKSVTPAEKKKLIEVLTAMCGDAEGKAICTDMRVEKFTAIDAASFAAFTKKYDAKK
jgi:ABC-type phosphate/phosphonate transport system substrate-binding protein